MPESEAAAVEPKGVDAGLLSLCLVAPFLGIPADHGELARRHLVSPSSASAEDLVCIDGKAPMQSPTEPHGRPVARISLDETAIETEQGRVRSNRA